MQAYLEQQRPLQKWKVQKKPDPNAAKAMACKDNSEGMPPTVATADEFMIDEAPSTGRDGGAWPGTNACSAARAALTTWTTIARNSGHG